MIKIALNEKKNDGIRRDKNKRNGKSFIEKMHPSTHGLIAYTESGAIYALIRNRATATAVAKIFFI